MDWPHFVKMFESIVNMTAYAFVGILLMFAGFKLFDWLTPKIDFTKELVERQNVAVGIFVGSIMVSIAAIIVAVIAS